MELLDSKAHMDQETKEDAEQAWSSWLGFYAA